MASVRSATVAQIVEAMIAQSDNEAAEVLLRHAAIAAGRPATFDGGVATVRSVLRRLDIDVSGLELHDGSGLSRRNRIAPQTLAEAVAVSARRPRTDSLISDLAVGGFTGTLARRFGKADAGRGVVRGKSGTLTGVHSLAGYVTDRSGTPIAFAVMTDRTKAINPFVTEDALDRVAAALAELHVLLAPYRRAMIDWNVALQTATRLSRPGPGPQPRAGGRRGGRAARGRGEVRGAGARVHRAARRRPPRRPSWSSTGAAGSRPTWPRSASCIDPVIARLESEGKAPKGATRAIGSKISGAEIGALMSFMSSKVLGQFDPFCEGRPAPAGGCCWSRPTSFRPSAS